MKHLIIKTSFFILLLTSCSSSSDNGSSSNNGHLNPPTWIQGTWLQFINNGGQQVIMGGFKFTNNDFCSIAITGSPIACFGQTFTTPPTEIITSTEYKFTITNAGLTNNYDFIKISNTQIRLENNDGIERIYTKQ